ncbi:MAG: YraN family protein [Planctomycetes bacterium]|nr:YraN family protein [Planctomycetota bacterium]
MAWPKLTKWLFALLRLLCNDTSNSGKISNSEIGREGERCARNYLTKNGWRVVGRNIRFGKDELDILAISPDVNTLVIVEVRTTMDRKRLPENTIDHKKRNAMLRVAKQLRWEAKKHNYTLRMDLITVRLCDKQPLLEHFKGILKLTNSRGFS